MISRARVVLLQLISLVLIIVVEVIGVWRGAAA
jgi:hypothetical protein